MHEIIFLWVLALVWVVFAVMQDLKTNEIANWLNFSLIIFALGYRFFYSLFGGSFGFFYQGVIGLGVFFLIGSILYYSRVFAGGDAKLMMAFGAILPFSNNFYENFNLFTDFLIIFLFIGAIYTLIISLRIALKNPRKFKKEFSKQFRKYRRVYTWILGFAVLIALGGVLFHWVLIYLGILFFIFPWLHVYAKSIDEGIMVENVSPKYLREGDWLYQNVKFKDKKIIPSWHGLSKKEISILKKRKKKIKIRKGIAFSPVFLITFLVLMFFYFSGISLGF